MINNSDILIVIEIVETKNEYETNMSVK